MNHVVPKPTAYLSIAFITAAKALCLLIVMPSQAQELPIAKAKAPENHAFLKRTVSGGYFVASPLKDEYDRLVERLRLLKAEIDSGRTTGAAALKELRELQIVIDGLRAGIEAKKVFVPLAYAQTATQTISFNLGPERCLLITADDVRVVGWDQPNVKCELENIVVSADDKPADGELEAIKLIHRHGRDTQKVGRTRAEFEADQAKLLASDVWQKLTSQAREERRRRAEDIFLSWAHLSDFQGKDVDMIDIEGLTHEQGNRQIQVEVRYDQGASVGSEWRRHAKITVFVPKSHSVAICGGGVHNLGMIDVQNLKASLVLSTNGTHKTAANEPFQVTGLEGSLRVKQVPLDLIDGVTGDVKITATVDLSNRGTSHGQGTLVGTRQPPLTCTCKNVGGDFEGWFGRVDLQLESIKGRVDVRNEFGETKLAIAGRPNQAAHRIISESGRIELSLSRGDWGDFPLFAVTQAGTFRSTAPQEFLLDFNVGTQDAEGAQRHWVGVRRPAPRAAQFDARDFLTLAARPRLALQNKDRSPGFDLISRGGTIIIETIP